MRFDLKLLDFVDCQIDGDKLAVCVSIMIGINTPMNFNHPYLAPNPQDFWRRFHINLGAWLTDYFFKPL